MRDRFCILLIVTSLTLVGCQSVYYDTMERMGVHKRDILVDRVVEAQESQEKAKEQLKQTEKDYNNLVKAMERAEAKMDPVLAVFNDQVLFLKHNLNARAIASIQKEVTGMEAEVANLIQDMNRAIAEAQSFVRQLRE